MVDYSELIFSEDFTEYRRAQMAVVVEYIMQILQDGINHEAKAEKLSGVLEIVSRIIKLPASLIKNPKMVEQLNKIIREDLVNISAFLVREYLKEIE